jgi:quinol monooxygenase YgiN
LFLCTAIALFNRNRTLKFIYKLRSEPRNEEVVEHDSMTDQAKGKILVTTQVTIRPERRREFFQTIAPLTERIRKEKGCMNYRLYEETGHENSLLLVEEWDAEEQWTEHRQGENFAVLLGLVNVLSIKAKIDFKLLSQIGGNEAIQGL